MLTRLAYRIHARIEHYLPEQRLYLKSDTATRFVRIRPTTQALAAVGLVAFLFWTVLTSSVFLMDRITAGSGREQAMRQQTLYEQRLTALSADRDARAEEAAGAQERFNQALAEVSAMQARLLASEDRRRELETGIDVIQNTLRRTIEERDLARAELQSTSAELAAQTGTTRSETSRLKDAEATLAYLSTSLGGLAGERDSIAADASRAREEAREIAEAKAALERRNDEIFAKLEEAVTVSMEPLDKMFREAGLKPENLLTAVRKGYSGQGGPLTPIVSTKGGILSSEETRANAILQGLDHMNLYRLAAFRAPFANPVPSGKYRYTSGFGHRNDPFGRGTRRHEGIDFAGAYGTPIVATADGVVIEAGWANGYGRMVKIQHDFGLQTLYGHMSEIHVTKGQKVSRGDRIGDMGNSGRSTGTHLHYEVRVGGAPVNPMTYIEAARNVF